MKTWSLFLKILVWVFVGVSCVSLWAGENKEPESPTGDQERLNELEKRFFETQSQGEQFGEAFWRASKRLADERGLAILPAVLERSKVWQGEEGMIFIPLVSLLPSEETVQELKRYQENSDGQTALWAGEFLIELDMSDTRQMVEKYQSEEARPVPPSPSPAPG